MPKWKGQHPKWREGQTKALKIIAETGKSKDVAVAYAASGFTPSSGRTMINKLMTLGYVRKSLIPGVWEITDQGKAALQSIEDRNTPKNLCEECGKTFGFKQQFRMSGPKKGRSGGYYKTKFCSRECYLANEFKSAKGVIKDGYHILHDKRAHRTVMEQILGRKLLRGETVHHKNGNRLDNRPENLELWSHNHPPGQRVSDTEDIWSGTIPPYQFGAL